MVAKPAFGLETATPLAPVVQDILDMAMIRAAKCNLVGRRLLHVDGPPDTGHRTKTPPPGNHYVEPADRKAEPLLEVEQTFLLDRDNLAHWQNGAGPELTRPVVEAALTSARIEDQLIFYGSEKTPGLLTAQGINEVELSAWDEAGSAVRDVGRAIGTLEEAGFCRPYALALTPGRYSLLFRFSPRLNQSELEHLREMGVEGVFRVPVMQSGGVLLSYGRQYLSITIEKDLNLEFVGAVGAGFQFAISHTFSLHIGEPAAICVLHAPAIEERGTRWERAAQEKPVPGTP